MVEAPPTAAAQAAGGAPADGSVVALEHAKFPASFPVATGETVLQAFFAYLDQREPGCDHAQFHKKPLDWSCLKGTCGLCMVQVLDGADRFDPVNPASPELDTLENKCFVDPDPKQFRLTCLAKIKGRVKIGIAE